MFRGCSSIISSPELPAMEATRGCYANMFRDCVSLTEPPRLPATKVDALCYQGMFMGCTSLVKLTFLPATTLATGCYVDMFRGCTSLFVSEFAGNHPWAFFIPHGSYGDGDPRAVEDMFSETANSVIYGMNIFVSINTMYHAKNRPV